MLLSELKFDGHFDIPKVIWSNGLGTYPIIDEDGKYALTQFSYGIIDDKGNRIREDNSTRVKVELTTSQLKNSYTILHKLVFNIRRLLGKIPLGQSTIARYAAALYLIKEHTKISDKRLIKILKEI